MSVDREDTNPLDFLDQETAQKLQDLRDFNGLNQKDIIDIALVLSAQSPSCKILLYEHQKNHYDIIDRLKEMGLKVNREHLNFQKYNKDNNTNLKTVLIITKK